ncbi:MAG: ADP-ribosylglycohydrolase family protein [Planctomycetales bacterium]|nr:ADP-ribosylglycohydrolase family protein [Planctomycetales bacterium]
MGKRHVVGCLIGTAVGDALGLPYEGLSRSRAARLLGPPNRHRFLCGRGMFSDDAEHSCMVAQSMIAAGTDPGQFAIEFGRRLRWWMLSLPAGAGRATVHSCAKLWAGFPPDSSGVFSAGNGPSMRAAVIGSFVDDLGQLTAIVRSATRITHSDPKAECGAIAVAIAAYYARHKSPVNHEDYLGCVAAAVGSKGDELVSLLKIAAQSAQDRQPTSEFAVQLGLNNGVTGYTYHTVPVAIHTWLSFPHDYRAAVTTAIECGGDADTTGAIVGGIVGTSTGEAGIPREWIESICDWPRSVAWIRMLAEKLAQTSDTSPGGPPPELNWLAIGGRNLVFLAIVLVHGFRRLAPPY